MVKYKVFRGTQSNEEIGSYQTYGISAYKKVGKQELFVDRLSDVSTNRAKVKGLAEYCNENQVSPFFISEVATEWIG